MIYISFRPFPYLRDGDLGALILHCDWTPGTGYVDIRLLLNGWKVGFQFHLISLVYKPLINQPLTGFMFLGFPPFDGRTATVRQMSKMRNDLQS